MARSLSGRANQTAVRLPRTQGRFEAGPWVTRATAVVQGICPEKGLFLAGGGIVVCSDQHDYQPVVKVGVGR